MKMNVGRRMGLRRLLRFGGVSWSPLMLPGVYAWLRGRPEYFTTTPTKVSAWNDASGNGNHFVQAVDAARPLYTASDAFFNGRSSTRWSATQALDCVNTLGNRDNVTVFLLTRPITVSGNQLMMQTGAPAGVRDFSIYQSGAADGPNLLVNGAAGLDWVKFAASDTTLLKYRRAFRMPFSALGTTLPDIHTDGVLSALSTISNTATSTTSDNDTVHLNGAYNGHIADVLILAGNGSVGFPTTAEIAMTNAWMIAEYGA